MMPKVKCRKSNAKILKFYGMHSMQANTPLKWILSILSSKFVTFLKKSTLFKLDQISDLNSSAWKKPSKIIEFWHSTAKKRSRESLRHACSRKACSGFLVRVPHWNVPPCPPRAVPIAWSARYWARSIRGGGGWREIFRMTKIKSLNRRNIIWDKISSLESHVELTDDQTHL